MDQDVTWYGGIVFDVDPATPSKKGILTPTQFWPVYCGQMAGWMKTPLGMAVDLSPGHIVPDGVPASLRENGTAAPLFSAHVYCSHSRPSQLLLSSCYIMKLCTRLLVLQCRNSPKDDKFR